VKGRNATEAEKRHMEKVRELGCIACMNMGIHTPPEYTCIHHIDGKTKAGAHFKVLPLCDNHHSRYQKTGLHYNPTEWQEIHGSQMKLLAQVDSLINKDY